MKFEGIPTMNVATLSRLVGLNQFFHPAPDAVAYGRVREVYIGLRGQVRICLVDKVGRIHHHDYEELERNAELREKMQASLTGRNESERRRLSTA